MIISLILGFLLSGVIAPSSSVHFGSRLPLTKRQIFYPERPMLYTAAELAPAPRALPPLAPEPLVLRGSSGSPLLPLSAALAEPSATQQPIPASQFASLSVRDALRAHLSRLPISNDPSLLGAIDDRQPFFSFTFGSSSPDGQQPFDGPPNTDPDNTLHHDYGDDYDDTETEWTTSSFACSDHSAAGYYGDVDAGCQVVHLCQQDGRHSRFSCPRGTLFSQKYRVCDWWFNVDCRQSPAFYPQNDWS